MATGSRSSKSGSANNAGCVFWLALFIVVLFVFLLNLGKIKETLDKTNFTEVVKTQRELDQTPPPVKSAPKVEADPVAGNTGSAERSAPAAPLASKPDGSAVAVAAPGGAAPAGDAAAPAGAAAAPTGAAKPAVPGAKPAAAPAAAKPAAAATPAAPAAAAPAPKSRQAALYFVRIDEDGTIVRQEVKRAVALSDSPLTDAVNALLNGPSEDELRRKLISLIPQGSKLLSVQVRGSTAVLNFSEEFMYNRYGIEGYAGQLKQVVYTATAFSTVQDVLIMIEGEKHDYLGGEGVFIGRPLSRNSF